VAGRLTTHVLDTASGGPAVGMAVELFRLLPERRKIGHWITNSDGRCDAPLLSDAALELGHYELLFAVGTWREKGHPGFYEEVPIRFRVTNPDAHYHVPLILAPFGYSTYRGS
jgi:5-hydroxyisourate hydrolase